VHSTNAFSMNTRTKLFFLNVISPKIDEEYVHLPQLRHVWTNPVTAYPRVEPFFSAACHGMELGFLLIADFIQDSRQYLVKQPRIEMVCCDILTQCQLLADLLDGELEDTSIKVRHDGGGEDVLSSSVPASVSASSTPFTTPLNKSSAVSPGLQILHSAFVDAFNGKCSVDVQKTLQKVLRSLFSAFHLHFGSFYLGFGIEHQLNMLGEVAGIFVDGPSSRGISRLPERPNNLDYAILVRPQVCSDSFLKENYNHTEDFFFRTVHLGTECWAFIAISRIDAAKAYASKNLWNQAASQIRYAAKILNYLGDHVFLLTAMVIRDYLQLKVEIQGTSGEGSLAVKSFRTHLLTLLECLAGNLLGVGLFPWNQRQERQLYEVLAYVYAHPAEYPGLYDFAKALEAIESALLGGFYYKHYLLAKNVIGSYARGTMEKMVGMLKMTFEVPCYPILDEVRGKLGVISDKQYEHNRAKIMDEIEAKHPYIPKADTKVSSTSRSMKDEDDETAVPELTLGQIISICMRSERPSMNTIEFDIKPVNLLPRRSFDQLWMTSYDVADEDLSPEYAARDRNRRSMYSSEGVVLKLQVSKDNEMKKRSIPQLQFLDHAFGAVPPRALEATLEHMYTMFAGFGNFSWDQLFGEALPEAAMHIKCLLGVNGTSDDDWKPTVEFGHNSHELVTRIISTTFDRLLVPNSVEQRPIRIVTTDSEFFSLTRQMNRFIESSQGSRDKIDIQVIKADPVSSLMQRLEDFIKSFPVGSVDFIYISQIAYTQQTLIFDIPLFVSRVRVALGADNGLILIDGYHGFGALPTNLTGVDAIYISGVLKHTGSGANLAFAVIPPTVRSLRPLLTGWLADVSVLGPGSGISMGSSVGYSDGLSLMGSTPSFHLAVELFNRVMRSWQFHNITVSFAHVHVLRLQRKFLCGLENLEKQGLGHKFINTKRLLVYSAPADAGIYSTRSHSLVFIQDKPEDGATIVSDLRLHGIAVDCRKSFVRIGIGLNHNPEDISRLLDALKSAAVS